MSGTNIHTLLELLSAFKKVEIPIVQRDYAQGRKDEGAKLVRQNLLADMKSAILQETQPLDLNFVYGKAEGGKFIPIDGQQRLTTLLLLHIFAFRDDASQTDLLNRFSYETRTSSRYFFESLVKNRCEVFSSDLPPSQEIEDCEWFVSGWKNDPTIQSVLVMLDEIKRVFGDLDDLAERLLTDGEKPIVFKFLQMEELGMEDSLYIKLNARGKPLTSFENFKARLIGRLKNILVDLENEFEQRFDREWANLFWEHGGKEKFDQIYLAFFGVLVMNKGIISLDVNWSNKLDFDEIDETVFRTAFYTLNYLCENPEQKNLREFIFRPLLEDRRTYPQRVLFHAITTYLYKSKGVNNGTLEQWLRIIKNLTLNSQIDEGSLYRAAIGGINKLAENWDNLLEYFAKNGSVTGFSSDQEKEEQVKARIILEDENFAEKIYKAEEHAYFSGQIRSALYLARQGNSVDIGMFESYWSKIEKLFDSSKPRYGHLFRQALLTFGDYTLPVDAYRTLCVDDPNEGTSTPSLKRLFSNSGEIVKEFLDTITMNEDIGKQLETIVRTANIPENDWRYCFVRYPKLFDQMSASYLRLRDVDEKWIIVPKKKSTGYNGDLYLKALEIALSQKGIGTVYCCEQGTWSYHYMFIKNYAVMYGKGSFFWAKDEKDTIIFKTESDAPITEAVEYLLTL